MRGRSICAAFAKTAGMLPCRFLFNGMPKQQLLQVLFSELTRIYYSHFSVKADLFMMHMFLSILFLCRFGRAPACEDIDSKDCKIAPEIKPLWLFAKEEDAYLSGPIRQMRRRVYRI